MASKTGVKVGRLKKEEENYIVAHAGKLVPQEIANNLNRSLKQVLVVLSSIPTREPAKDTANTAALRAGLKESAMWKNLKAEFEPNELVYFEEQYIALMEQFKQDEVLHTEENQVFKVIKIDIMKHRNAVRQKECARNIDKFEILQSKIIASKEYQNFEKKAISDLEMVELKLQTLYSQQKTFSDEYIKLEEKHQKLMVDLKATREQRVDEIASNKVDFLSVIRDLGNDKIAREKEKQQELMKLATLNEFKRLSQPHQFPDGEIDRPILNADTVLLEPEEKEDEE